jgi:structural maintenance of chromosome 4
MIEKIVLENFKSYYGRKEIGPLHKCFSAVVGPNGSGKSNLIESLLFVFGKRAKRMRLNKLAELIHSSAEHENDVKYAQVEVYFQEIWDDENEPDHYEVIPGTEFQVARRVDRQSVSKYRLNGQDSSFKEVCDKLQHQGIDLEHNRFLILQGEVEQISLMKPIAANPNETGLLEYLEDIIGSNRYLEQIQTLEKALEDKNDERIEKTNRVKAAQVEMKSLEKEKDIAVNYIKKERDYMLLTNMLYFIELGDAVKAYNQSVEQLA